MSFTLNLVQIFEVLTAECESLVAHKRRKIVFLRRLSQFLKGVWRLQSSPPTVAVLGGEKAVTWEFPTAVEGKGHKSPGSGGLSEEVGAIFSPQESGGEAILGMVKMLGAHSFERFRRLSSGGMKPKTIFAGAGVWREMRICIGIFFYSPFRFFARGEEEGPERTPEIFATSLRNQMNREQTSVESWMRPNIFNINRPPKADRPG